MKNNLIVILATLLISSCNNLKKSTSQTEQTISSTDELSESIKKGKEIYTDFCVTCHMPNGKGVPKSFPPLAKSDYLMNNRTLSIKAIKYGMSDEIMVNGEIYNMPMASLGLSDEEVADVMNYITNSWGNKNLDRITVKEVSEIKP